MVSLSLFCEFRRLDMARGNTWAGRRRVGWGKLGQQRFKVN